MASVKVHILILNAVFLVCIKAQQYDFAAEITRQCLVPDPVGLLDCVENKVDLPYLTSWVECTNSLGENVATSADIINYRCKSVWEGKGVIPEVFFIKDCVIEKTGLPAPNVSAKVLGAYKECESGSPQNAQAQKSTPAVPNSLPQNAPPPVQYSPPPPPQQNFGMFPAPQIIPYPAPPFPFFPTYQIPKQQIFYQPPPNSFVPINNQPFVPLMSQPNFMQPGRYPQ